MEWGYGKPTKTFRLILIKPSKYDDDGYVIQWMRSQIPSNSLAVLYGIALDCAERRVLGNDVEISLTVCDETNTRVDVGAFVESIRATGGHGLVGLVGVQSNQFPRAVDLCRQFLSEGVQVCIGGFHVSGCVAMLPELPADLQEAVDLGISLFAGEAEGHLEDILRDAYQAQLKPIYNFMPKLPDLAGTSLPYLPAEKLRGYLAKGALATFDAGRGCPFHCSFCTIINVQGHKMRSRTADDVEDIVRRNLAGGVANFFIADDNFARNSNWEAIFDRLIKLREEDGVEFTFFIQVDTACHRIPRFIEKAGRAGVVSAFIGLENINPESLTGAQKGQNLITEYHPMLQAWHAAGVVIGAGYILGFPNDTRDSILRDIEIIKRELPIDVLDLFILTPLPGSADHKKLYEDGIQMDSDMNRYDTWHVVTDHPRMTRQELHQAYLDAWEAFYTKEHVKTIFGRSLSWANSKQRRRLLDTLFYFTYSTKIEKFHPLVGGRVRRRHRRDRRPGMPLENPIVFYTRYFGEVIVRRIKGKLLRRDYINVLRHVEEECKPSDFDDVTAKNIQDDDYDGLSLFKEPAGARNLIETVRRKRRTAVRG